MQTPIFSDDQFVNASSFSTAFSQGAASLAAHCAAANIAGVVSPSALGFSANGLVLTVNTPAPFAVLFGSGVLASGSGTTSGQISSAYSVPLSSFLPGSGSATVYIVAQAFTLPSGSFVVSGAPAGMPDYDPTFQPYVAYSYDLDSLAITATTTAPDNVSSIELGRLVLTPGQTALGAVDTSHQVGLGSVLSQAQLNAIYAEVQSETNYFTGVNTFSQSPIVPTAASGDNSTKAANTAFVAGAVAAEATARIAAESLLAPKASPVLTGVPTAPTATPGTNNLQIASTAFVGNAVLGETLSRQQAESLLVALTMLTTATWITTVNKGIPVAAPSWAGRYWMLVVGGGGGGSNCIATKDGSGNYVSAFGGGGGGGGWAIHVGTVSPGAVLTFVVGAGGTPEASGGTTSFYAPGSSSPTVYATGGSGSSFTGPYNCPGAGGGVGVGGNQAIGYGSCGNDGQQGQFFSISGSGGSSLFAGAGRAGNTSGAPGLSFGAGGGGAYDTGFTAAQHFGGTGFQGVAVLLFLPPL